MTATERRHHVVVRVTHWVNAIALTLMITSGLRIFNSYPAFARQGETFCCYPSEGHKIPGWLTFGGWLAGARHWHGRSTESTSELTLGTRTLGGTIRIPIALGQSLSWNGQP